MDCRAVITFLGFPGWGPLHVHLPEQGHPSALARRLGHVEQVLAGLEGRSLDARFLAVFLVCQPDLVPLRDPRLPPDPLSGPRAHYRYRIVCRYGAPEPLRICCWRWGGTSTDRLSECTGPMTLRCFIEGFHLDPDRRGMQSLRVPHRCP